MENKADMVKNQLYEETTVGLWTLKFSQKPEWYFYLQSPRVLSFGSFKQCFWSVQNTQYLDNKKHQAAIQTSSFSCIQFSISIKGSFRMRSFKWLQSRGSNHSFTSHKQVNHLKTLEWIVHSWKSRFISPKLSAPPITVKIHKKKHTQKRIRHEFSLNQ